MIGSHFCDRTGRVFTCWDQVAAATGRITSVSPNIQAIPKGDLTIGQLTVNLRSPFKPASGYTFLAADFEQIEFRIFGQLSQDCNIMDAIRDCREGSDIFRNLASTWLDRPLEQVQEEDRDKTKRLVYALMYAAGKHRVSEILGITAPQAATLISSFYSKFSSLKTFSQRVIGMAERNGFLASLLGRRRYFPTICSTNPGVKAQAQRQAFNFLIQGSAADIAKTGLIRVEENLAAEQIDSNLVMLIHDEMVWEVREDSLLAAASIVKSSLESFKEVHGADGQGRTMEMKVKLFAGKSWGKLLQLNL